MKSAEDTRDYSGKDPKDKGKCIFALNCPLLPPSFVSLFLSSEPSQNILNSTPGQDKAQNYLVGLKPSKNTAQSLNTKKSVFHEVADEGLIIIICR